MARGDEANIRGASARLQLRQKAGDPQTFIDFAAEAEVAELATTNALLREAIGYLKTILFCAIFVVAYVIDQWFFHRVS